MQIKLLYFSGTGNTKLITKKLKKQFDSKGIDVELLKVEEVLNDSRLLNMNDNNILLGIGFPIYDLLPPDIITKCIDLLPETNIPTPVFIYSTMGFIMGDCHNILARKLKKKGYYTIKKIGFKCPSNGAVTYEHPNHPRYRYVRFEKGIDEAIIRHVNETISVYEKFIKKPFTRVGLIFPHYNVVRFFSERLFGNKYYKNLRINKNCINCGLCVKLCPDDNLIMDNKVQVLKDNDCMRCLRCVSICSQNAISFTSSPLIKRYTPELMKQLYDEANT